ncbi:hypothetical protein PVAP13_8KG248609 [Panicum virgatum]|uniref:Uncharacterized protein n=1 Tax=Panicum virgatum TaxID=38727 RepID=A0A8T0PJ05_PANVG|nr:hypothetical protein PVAP13_8KG248609 [Panicum virgatum]
MNFPYARQQQGIDWYGYYICDYIHGLVKCEKDTTEDCRISQVYNAAFDINRINAVCQQLARFIVKKILDPRGKFYHDGHINRVSASTS